MLPLGYVGYLLTTNSWSTTQLLTKSVLLLRSSQRRIVLLTNSVHSHHMVTLLQSNVLSFVKPPAGSAAVTQTQLQQQVSLPLLMRSAQSLRRAHLNATNYAYYALVEQLTLQ